MSFSKLTMVSFDGNLGVALEKKLSFFQSLMLQVKNEYGPHLWKKKDSNEMEQLFQFIIHQIDAGLFDDVVFTYDNFSVAGDHIKNGFNVLNQMGAKSGRLASNSYWVTYGLFDKKSHKVKNSILKNGQISGVGKLINETDTRKIN